MASPGASAPTPHREVQGVRVPCLIYGTAWKEGRTAALTRQALDAGFRAIDTANQRRHYHEAAVGEAVQAAMREGRVTRDDLFIQTKFTFAEGQDHRLPYDPRAPVEAQVEQSFASSLEHLGVERLDAYLLHGPSKGEGLGDRDWEAWRAMEALQRAGRTRIIGVSNVTARQLEETYKGASVRPAIVQNRCFTRPIVDRKVREFCKERGVVYEAFSLLTGSPGLLAHPTLRAIAARVGKTPAQVVFRFAIEQGWVALTGTASRQHMGDDLDALSFALQADEVEDIANRLGA